MKVCAPHLSYLGAYLAWVGGEPVFLAAPPQILASPESKTWELSNIPKSCTVVVGAPILAPPGLERAPMTLQTIDLVNQALREDQGFMHAFCRCTLELADDRCTECGGTGEVVWNNPDPLAEYDPFDTEDCPRCNGTGKEPKRC